MRRRHAEIEQIKDAGKQINAWANYGNDMIIMHKLIRQISGKRRMIKRPMRIRKSRIPTMLILKDGTKIIGDESVRKHIKDKSRPKCTQVWLGEFSHEAGALK